MKGGSALGVWGGAREAFWSGAVSQDVARAGTSPECFFEQQSRAGRQTSGRSVNTKGVWGGAREALVWWCRSGCPKRHRAAAVA
eukprot:1158855-Pelagomonas_calceolata.AAC.12